MFSATTGSVASMTGRDRSDSTCTPCQSTSPPLARSRSALRPLPRRIGSKDTNGPGVSLTGAPREQVRATNRPAAPAVRSPAPGVRRGAVGDDRAALAERPVRADGGVPERLALRLGVHRGAEDHQEDADP